MPGQYPGKEDTATMILYPGKKDTVTMKQGLSSQLGHVPAARFWRSPRRI